MRSHFQAQRGSCRSTRLAATGVAIVTALAIVVLTACTSGSTNTAVATAISVAATKPVTRSPASAPTTTASVPTGTPRTNATLVVDTSAGRLRGVATSTAREFLGVRYAQPPTGARR